MSNTKLIHMNQKQGLYGCGWTRCGKGQQLVRANVWGEVTCKECLRHKVRK